MSSILTKREIALSILRDQKWHLSDEFSDDSENPEAVGIHGKRRIRELRKKGYDIQCFLASDVFPQFRGSIKWIYRLVGEPAQISSETISSSSLIVGESLSIPEWIKPETFFHTHLHSIFSLRDGMIPISGLIENAKKNNQRVVAITDHGLLGSAFELYMRATKAGIAPMFGVEFYTSPYRNILLSERDRISEVFKKEKELRDQVRRVLSRSHHLVALSYNAQGYKNLLAIHNESQINGFYRMARTMNRRVMELNDGLVISSACFAGEIPQLLWRGNEREARYLVYQFKEAFQDRFFIELMLIDWDRQIELNRMLIRLAHDTNTPMIFSCDAHYLRQEDAKLHKILLNIGSIRDGKSLADLAEEENIWEFEAKDLFVKNVADIWHSFCVRHRNETFTEDVLRECFENIERIGSMAEPIHLEHTPRLPSPEGAWDELVNRCVDGLNERLNNKMVPDEKKKDYIRRLKFELDVIRRIQSVEYILLFSDVSHFCDENDIPRGPGRGSVGGSLVAWLTDITQVDPIQHGLLFERFLDLERLPRMKLGL